VEPSIIEQVTSSEITVDPYLKALMKKYYYRLSREMVISSMQIVPQDSSAPSLGNPQNKTVAEKKVVTVDIISELINEIEASDQLDLKIQIPEKANEIPPSSTPRQGIRFSLAHQKRSVS